LKIRVLVKPRARMRELRPLGDGEYVAAVQSPARDGQANRALIDLLAESFSVPKACVRIVLGKTGRKKVVEILR
jgi:uncharacterized protein (TIGR00251 family)